MSGGFRNMLFKQYSCYACLCGAFSIKHTHVRSERFNLWRHLCMYPCQRWSPGPFSPLSPTPHVTPSAPNIPVFLQRLISGEVSADGTRLSLDACGFQSHGHNHLLLFPLIEHFLLSFPSAYIHILTVQYWSSYCACYNEVLIEGPLWSCSVWFSAIICPFRFWWTKALEPRARVLWGHYVVRHTGPHARPHSRVFKAEFFEKFHTSASSATR
jgi:hypothetical protein